MHAWQSTDFALHKTSTHALPTLYHFHNSLAAVPPPPLIHSVILPSGKVKPGLISEQQSLDRHSLHWMGFLLF